MRDDETRDATRDTRSAWEPAPARKIRRGFAVMDPARQREMASKGGKAAHAKGTAYEWTSEQARAAGRKGGLHRRHSARAQGDVR